MLLKFLTNLFKPKDNSALIALLKSDASVVIDVRTTGEFNSGHMTGSINIPLGELPKNVAKIQKMNKSVVVCCASGMRSKQAEMMLKSQGIDAQNGGSWSAVQRLKQS
jgi:phage shock protein E